jgi:aspartyl-tRNA(Asn)/glutamyl-tRNA(Gln) amidotransferase subunit B
MVDGGRGAVEIIAARGLAQISDEAALAAVIERIIAANPDPLAAYLNGKASLRGWFVGQVMRETRGQANPSLVNDLLRQALDEKSAGNS